MERLLPLLISCFLLLESFAQDEYVQKYTFDALDRFEPSVNTRQPSAALNDSNIVLYDFSLKGRKPGIYRLPQDNMPCIVPDSSKTVQIPNAWKGPKRVPYRSNPPRIPNLTKPWKPFPITNPTDATK